MPRCFFGEELDALPVFDVPAQVRAYADTRDGIVSFYSTCKFHDCESAFAFWWPNNDMIRYDDGITHGLNEDRIREIARQVWDEANGGKS